MSNSTMNYMTFYKNKLSHDGMNIHQKFDTLVSTFKNLLDKHAPLIRQSRRERKLAQKPWITKAIMVSIGHKNRFFSKICKNRTPSATNAYKKYRNLLTRIKYKAKQNYYQYLFSAYQKNSSKTWATIHDIIDKKKEGSVIPKVVIIQDNQKVTNFTNICNEFNKFFASVAPKMADRLPLSNFRFDHYMTDINQFDHYMTDINFRFDNYMTDINFRFDNYMTDINFRFDNYMTDINQ